MAFVNPSVQVDRKLAAAYPPQSFREPPRTTYKTLRTACPYNGHLEYRGQTWGRKPDVFGYSKHVGLTPRRSPYFPLNAARAALVSRAAGSPAATRFKIARA